MHGYRDSQVELSKVLDNELKTLASFILNKETESNSLEITNPISIENKTSKDKAFQIFDTNNKLVARSANAPSTPISNTVGFSEEAFSGIRWRTYLVLNDSGMVIVAQSDEYRRRVTESILLATLVPIVVAIPLIGMLVFYIVRKSLSPLRELSSQLTNKHSEDLSGLEIPIDTQELSPVINRLNDLFERLSSSFELEKQLSANAAHELRTPISVLAIASNNLKDEFEKGTLKHEHFMALHNNVERMAQVIEQIISLFRFSKETIDSKKSVFDFEKLLQQVIANNYLSIEKAHQNIALEALPTPFFACEFALYALFENLVRNAIKYGGDGCDIILRLSKKANSVSVDIHDSGPGLTQADMERLTQRFFRAENQTHIKGSGLGLSISKHIVNLHRGSLTFSASNYGGLHVQVTLPIEKN